MDDMRRYKLVCLSSTSEECRVESEHGLMVFEARNVVKASYEGKKTRNTRMNGNLFHGGLRA